MRGSSPDGALYWFCRMLDGGADPRYLARRIVRMAWEDIGLADPRAARIALDAAETYERLGTPEGELALAQAIIYLAVAPKSNAGYNAYNEARRFVSKDQSRGVPVHLRNAPTKLMKELGYGHEYRYAHDEPDAYAAGETYLPDEHARSALVRADAARSRRQDRRQDGASGRAGCAMAQREQAEEGLRFAAASSAFTPPEVAVS